MIVDESINEQQEIENLCCNLDKERFTIRWKWPKNIEIVYILKINIFQEFSLDNINESNMKIYTREEYREFNGYCETIKEINQYKFFIFPAVERENEVVLLKQNNDKNQIIIITGIPEIYYEIREIKYLSKIFSKEKQLRIILRSEIALSKDVLCYVKKQGSYPINKEDGICFDFIDDIYSGTNVMPEITVYKNEFVKVFIKDIKKYGSVYKLKKE